MKKISYVVFDNSKTRFTSATSAFHKTHSAAVSKLKLLATSVKNAVEHDGVANTPSHTI